MELKVKAEKPTKVSKNGTAPKYSKETYLNWYEMMLRIRKFEEATLMKYAELKIRGFLHVYIGQEAIAAGMASALRKEDPVVTAYRQHGTAISRGIGTKECMAELFGKVTGVVKGKGGSMHFFSKEHYFFGGNGIVGAQIPIGTGIAFAEKYKGTDNVCVTMFGDGAARQGALYESFNMAMTWGIPVLYIVENNGYAMGTSIERTSNVHDMYKIGSAFDMPSKQVDGMDAQAVHEGLTEALEHIRKNQSPYFLEIKTYRYRGHSVSDPAKYRTKEELEAYKAIDPVHVLPAKIVNDGIATQAEIDAIDKKIDIEIDEALAFAEVSPLPDGEALLYEDCYAEPNYPFIMD